MACSPEKAELDDPKNAPEEFSGSSFGSGVLI